jgi:hypothetical protein
MIRDLSRKLRINRLIIEDGCIYAMETWAIQKNQAIINLFIMETRDRKEAIRSIIDLLYNYLEPHVSSLKMLSSCIDCAIQYYQRLFSLLAITV